MLRHIAHSIIETTDRVLEVVAPKIPGVAGAGLFWLGDGRSSRWEAWTDKASNSTFVRMGKLEFGIDWK